MKKIWVWGLVILLVGSSLAWAEEKIIDPKTLEGKTLEEIYLMRNEIYARHGKPFKTYELDSYFRSQDWYKLNLEFKDSLLTKADWKNISILQTKEKELLQQNYITKDGQQRVNFNNIINTRQFGAFTAEEKEKISINGFVVIPAKHEQFFHVYDENAYLGAANFVTTDALLQLYHVFYDYTLRNIEKEKLFPQLKILTREMLRHSRILYGTAKNPQVKEAARRNLAFFAVADYFLTDILPKMDPALTKIVKEEISRCQKHAGRQNSLIFNPPNDSNIPHVVDYTQFIIRGHYTKSKELQRFFMVMMWFGLNSFATDIEMDLLQSYIIYEQLGNRIGSGKEELSLFELWGNIYGLTVYYVGISNNLHPRDFDSILYQVFGEGSYDDKKEKYSWFADKQKVNLIKKKAEEIYNQRRRIKVQMLGGPEGPQFSFMGQRYLPDSDILQQLAHYPERPFPKGLDVMAGLGSVEARKLLLEEYKEGDYWKEYPQKLDKVIKEFKELHPDDWHQNLYYNWLWSLKSLVELRQGFKYPFFMQTQGWQRKSLTSSLASWAELRHDTIVYGTATVAECGDGEPWIPDPPKGYVEPNIVFYQRLGELLTSMQGGLKGRNLLTPDLKGKFGEFLSIVSFLERAAVKEMNGEFLTNGEYDELRHLGGRFELLTLTVLADDFVTWDQVSETDRNMAVIADVATSLDQVLEVGVGPAFEIYVVVDIGRYLKLTRGAVFSYYEFIHPAGDRLTDAKWQQMLKEGKASSPLSWTKLYLSDKLAREVPRPKYNYVDICKKPDFYWQLFGGREE